MFRGSVKGTGYPPYSTVSPSLPLPRVSVCHHISTGLCCNDFENFLPFWVRLRLKCDGTSAETRFRLSAQRRVHLNRAVWRQFSRLLAAEVCASAVVMLDTPCSEVVWRVLATHCIRLSVKRTSPFKSRGVTSVQSTAASRGVRISGSNAGYTVFRGSVKGTGYPLHSPVSPFTSRPARRRVPSHFNWSLRAASSYKIKIILRL